MAPASLPAVSTFAFCRFGDTQKKMMMFEIDRVRQIRDGKALSKNSNPFRSKYIHILNLQTLFEFCLPAIQDYGSLLKSNDFLLILHFITFCFSSSSVETRDPMIINVPCLCSLYFFGTGRRMVYPL